MKRQIFISLSVAIVAFSNFGTGEYVGPSNGNANAYGVPSGSFTPPPSSGPYPPSGWKPAGRRLLLPGESRQGLDPTLGTSFSQYGPSTIDSQYGPSVDNHYIPGGNGNGNGNGHNGNGHNGNGNGHNGNGFGNGNGHNGNGNGHNGNGNGHNGNGFGNGNGHNGNGNGHNGNGNGHNGNGFGNGNGNGHNGNGNGHNGNGNGHNGNGFGNGNGHNGNGNGHNGNGFGNGNGNGHNGNGLGNGNGHNGNGNGHNGNGFGNGNGNGHNGNGNGHNGSGNGNSNGNGFNQYIPVGNGNGNNANDNQNGFVNGFDSNGHSNGNVQTNGNGKTPSLNGVFPNQDFGTLYPFLRLSIPNTVAALRPNGKTNNGESFRLVYQLPSSYSSGAEVFASSVDSSNTLSAQASTYPFLQALTAGPTVGGYYTYAQVPFAQPQSIRIIYPGAVGDGGGYQATRLRPQYTILPGSFPQKSHLYAVKRRR